ncbi:MAG: alkyl hydroperoxide reductase [Candidatus Solibacter sp.]|nr:alkyl hydroperoxide reductase [Candidatus Solibacter sp.]
MKSPVLITLTAALAFALAGCNNAPAGTAAGADLKPSAKRNVAPDFELTDADGRKVKLSDYKGKVVLLNFWATWCGPCKLEIPWFVEFEKTYKDKGFAVLGVSMDEEGWQIVKPYIQDKQVNYRVMVATEEVAQKYGGVEALPTTFMIDRQGRIASTHIGLVSKKDYADEIAQLLR